MTLFFKKPSKLSNVLHQRKKNPSPIAGMKGSFKKYVSTRQKKSFLRQEFLKTYKKWFVQARKFVSTNLNEAFVEKYVSIIQKNCFFWQENQRKWFWKCFSLKLVPPNFNNGYQHQKKSSEQKHSVSTRQKISFHQPE